MCLSPKAASESSRRRVEKEAVLVKLEMKDRMMLALQFRILEKLDPDMADSCSRAITILEQGYELEYDSIYGMIDQAFVSTTVCKEVFAILEMYRRLRNGYDQLADKSGIDAQQLVFPGFDGNNEGEHLSYGQFLNSDGRYAESTVVNSHLPTIAIYQRMLGAFEPLKQNVPLSKADIQTVLAARIHPSRRT